MANKLNSLSLPTHFLLRWNGKRRNEIQASFFREQQCQIIDIALRKEEDGFSFDKGRQCLKGPIMHRKIQINTCFYPVTFL